jgi:hypothetical protein
MQPLIEQLKEKMASGSEQDVRAFVIEHFKEFPEETQQELAVELFSEAMSNDVAESEKIAELKKEFLDTMEPLDQL